MTEVKDYDICGSYNNLQTSSIDCERSINIFEYVDPKAKKQKTMLPSSGTLNSGVSFDGASNGFRRSFFFNGNTYHVIGNQFWMVSAVNVPTLIGSLTTNAGFVGIDANTNSAGLPYQIMIVDGQKGYIYDTTTAVFEQITDQGFPSHPVDCCNLDNFFVVVQGTTPNFQLSSLAQGLVWSGVAGNSDTFTLAAHSSALTLTSGTTLNYQVGTPITVSGSSVAEIPNGNYFVVSIASPTVFSVSATNGGAAIGSAAGGGGTITNNGQLQQGTVSTHSGTLVACRTLHRRLFLFTGYFTEVWENAGLGSNLPFRRNNSLLMEFGTPSAGSISVSFDMMCFLSQTKGGLGSVMMVKGTEALPISTPALDAQLNIYNETVGQGVADAFGELIKDSSFIFYRLNFTAANATYVYNVTMSTQEERRWHEEQDLYGNRSIGQTSVYVNGNLYYGSFKGPILYLVSSAYNNNDGQVIPRVRIGKPVCPEGYQRLRIDRFQLDLLQGQLSDINIITNDLDLLTESLLSIDTESGINILLEDSETIIADANPVVYLSISKDGGQSYGPRIVAPMGTIGQRTFRTIWRKLGTTKRGQAFVPKIEFFNQVPFVILGAAWGYEVLPQ